MITFQRLKLVKDYARGCLLDYLYKKNYHNMIAIDSSKQQELNADPKVIQQISFTGNLNRPGNIISFSIIEEATDHSSFFTRNCENAVNKFYNLFCFDMISV